MFSVFPLALLLVAAPSPQPVSTQPRTAAAVIAADEAWLQAEINGDGNRLTELLAPGYMSVDPAGRPIDRATLIAAARKRGPSTTRAAEVAAWRASHPTKSVVIFFGNTAVLSWTVVGVNLPAVISSVDIFVYDTGAWRAIYSQHSTASS